VIDPTERGRVLRRILGIGAMIVAVRLAFLHLVPAPLYTGLALVGMLMSLGVLVGLWWLVRRRSGSGFLLGAVLAGIAYAVLSNVWPPLTPVLPRLAITALMSLATLAGLAEPALLALGIFRSRVAPSWTAMIALAWLAAELVAVAFHFYVAGSVEVAFWLATGFALVVPTFGELQRPAPCVEQARQPDAPEVGAIR
jgi:hypothetical protein